MNRIVSCTPVLGLPRRGGSRAADIVRYTTIRSFFKHVAQSTGDARFDDPIARHRVSQSPRTLLPENKILGMSSLVSSQRRNFSRYATLYAARDGRDGQSLPARPSPTQPSSTQSPPSKPSPTQPSSSQTSSTQLPSAQSSSTQSLPARPEPAHAPPPPPPPLPPAGSSPKNESHEEPKGVLQNSKSTQPSPEQSSSAQVPNGAPTESPNPHFQNYSALFRRLALSLPHVKQPKKDDFLQATTNMWERMRIRFKWFTIKSFRRFNADDMSAFLSWFLVGQTLWILIGTTTFFSVIFAILNSLSMQEYVARSISDYLTSETGIRIVFESAVVPKWKNSSISFRNVYVSRRQNAKGETAPHRDAGQHAAARLLAGHHPAYHDISYHDDEDHHGVTTEGDGHHVPEDADAGDGWTMFDLDIDSVDVTFSFARWLDGKGLIKNATVKGVRGVVDRRSVYWDAELYLDPAAFRHPSELGDFELESLEVEDLLVTVYQPGNFRPYTASIFNANFGVFRKQWIFYDLMSAHNIVGQYDNCLFSLHTPQSIGRTMEQDVKDSRWTRMSRFRIDGVNIDHLQAATDNEGLVSWISSGKVDAVLDIKFPRNPNQFDIGVLIEGIAAAAAEQIEGARRAGLEFGIPLLTDRIPGQRELAKPALTAPQDDQTEEEHETPVVVIDIDLRFRDLKAAMPLFTRELSYVNLALVRPIVSFINANRTLIPIRCRVVKELEEFHGAWTMWETGLTDIVAQKTYDAVAYHVTQANMQRRLKTVAMWNLHLASRNLISAARNIVDPMSAHLRAAYAI